MHLETLDINILAVVVAAIAQFVLGWVWYSPGVFGKQWATAQGGKEPPPPSPKLALFLIGALIAAGVIATVYGWAGGDGLLDGLVVGVVLSLFLLIFHTLEGLVMGGRSMSYVLIQDGYTLVGYALMGTIIGVLN